MAADLVATGFTANGEELVVTYDVNTNAATSFDIGVYRSSDGETPEELLFSERITDSAKLALGTGHEIALTADFTDVQQDYKLIIVLDSSAEISETSETNNSLVFAGGVFQAVDGTVHVHGTEGADDVEVEVDSDLLVWNGSTSYPFDLESITGVHVRLHGGNDSFTASGYTEPTWVFGGAGEDSLGTITNTPLHWQGGADGDHPEISDNQDVDYEEVGTWSDHSTADAFNETQREHAAGTGENTAAWTWSDLTEDGYEVFVTWEYDASAATDAKFEIFDGTTSLGVITVDQSASPSGNNLLGRAWQRLGVFTPLSGTLQVVLSDDANGLVLADAVRLIPDGKPTTTGLSPVTALENDPNKTINLASFFSDADSTFGDSLAYSIVSNDNSALVSASITAAQLTLDYATTGYGVANLVVRAIDSHGMYVDTDLTVTVKNVISQSLGTAADASVAHGADANTNFGTWTYMPVFDSTNNDYDSQTYFKFDLSQVSGVVTQAKIRLMPNDGTGAVQSAWHVPSDSWSETTIKGNNKPSVSTQIASWTVSAGQRVEIDVTSAVQSILASGGMDQALSIRIQGNGTWMSYRSREYLGLDGGQPQLVLTGAFANSGAPTGEEDEYVADNNGTALSVSARYGVLANDTDSDIYDLSAVPVDGPTHGTLDLNADGSFTYTATEDYVGTDTFTYRAADPDYQSDPVTVTINVRALTQQSLGAAADSFVAFGVNANTNYGTWSNYIYNTPASPDFTEQAYIRFDLSQFGGEISQAKLRLMPTHGTGAVHAAWLVPNDTWGETTITANNRPPVSYQLATWTVTAGQWVEVDVTNAIRDILESGGADQAFSLRVQSVSTDVWSNYISREYLGLNGGQPQLVLTGAFANSGAPTGEEDEYVADNNGTALNVSARYGVLANDTDSDIYDLSAVLVDGPSHGTLDLNADGSFTYTATEDYVGTDTFTYRAADPDYQSDPVTVTINVRALTQQTLGAAADAFVSYGTLASTNYGTWNQMYVRDSSTFSDYDNQAFLRFDLSQLSGEISQATLRLMPFVGTGAVHSAWLVPNDAWGETTITANNRPGVSYELGNWTVTAGQWVELDVTDAIRDMLESGGADQAFSLRISSVTLDVFADYYSRQWNGSSGQPQLVLTRTYPPIGVADAYAGVEDEALIVDAEDGVLANDSDPTDDPLLAILDENHLPQHGAVILNEDGSFEYTPDEGFHGVDSFRYFTSDGLELSSAVTVTLTINGRPIANDDTYLVNAGAVLSASAPGVKGNDTDPESDSLTAELVDGPSHASAFSLNANGSFSYAASETTGPDSFTYRVWDGQQWSAPATVNITINGLPVAGEAEEYEVNEDGALTVNIAQGVLANDTDPENQTLSAILVQTTTHGTLQLAANGSFVYTPTADYFGSDQFTYKASDGIGGFSTPVTVTIEVLPIPDAPRGTTIPNQFMTVESADLILNLSQWFADPDSALPGTSLIYSVTNDNSAFLQVTVEGASLRVHRLTESTGVANIVVKATDELGAFVESGFSTTVRPSGHADEYHVAVNEVLRVSMSEGLLANDLGGSRVLELENPQYGVLSVNESGAFVYRPNANLTGLTDQFRYTFTDGFYGSDWVTVKIVIGNEPPVAKADEYTLLGSETGILNVLVADGVLANDSDVDSSGSLTAELVQGPSHGTLTLNEDGSFTYTTTEGVFFESDSFQYRAFDGSLHSEVVSVTISLRVQPTGQADSYELPASGPLVIDAANGVLENDTTEEEGTEPVTVILTQNVQHGTLTLHEDGSFTYQSNGPQGPITFPVDSFRYRISDGDLLSDEITVKLWPQPISHGVHYGYFDHFAGTLYEQDNGVWPTLNVSTAAGLKVGVAAPAGVTLNFTLHSAPEHGDVSVSEDGHFSYTPTSNPYAGNGNVFDSFDFEVSYEADGLTMSTTATVRIFVPAYFRPGLDVQRVDNVTQLVEESSVLVRLNDDDDNSNDLEDYLDSSSTDPDLIRITVRPGYSDIYDINQGLHQPEGPEVSYRLTWDTNYLRVWQTANRSTELWSEAELDFAYGNTYYLEGISESAPHDSNLRLERREGSGSWEQVTEYDVTVFRYDLDADSGNTLAAEETEDVSPGLIVIPTSGDADDDQIPDFADFETTTAFTPIYWDFSSLIDELASPNEVKIRFYYDASDPTAVQEDGQGNYLAAPGHLRLWTKDASGGVTRDPASVAQDGDYVPASSGEDFLTFENLEIDQESGHFTFYLEGIGGRTQTTVRIEVEVPIQNSNGIPHSYLFSDSILVTVDGIDLDIDSDNNCVINVPDAAAAEDSIEDSTVKLGKLILVQSGDEDRDGLPGFAEGFELPAGLQGAMPWTPTVDANYAIATPLAVRLPLTVNTQLAKIKFVYQASDPNGMTYQDGRVTPAEGYLRIWTTSAARSLRSLADGGNFVAANEEISISALGNIGSGDLNEYNYVFYVEGIKQTTAAANGRIEIWIDADGNGQFESMDVVQVSVVNEVSVTAVDAFAAETATGQPTDKGQFVISRGEGNTTGDLDVYFRIVTPGNGTTQATVDADYSFSNNVSDPQLGAGIRKVTIAAGQSSVLVQLTPESDTTVEWDETVTLQLLKYTELPAGEEEESDPPPSSFYLVNESHSSAAVTILDNDGIGALPTRNLDTATSGLVAETISAGPVSINVQTGSPRLVLPLFPGEFGPMFDGNDNLQPVFTIDTQLPTFDGVPEFLTATVTLAGIVGPTMNYTTADLAADNLSNYLRFNIVGPANLVDVLASGHYDYSVAFSATIGNVVQQRTIRGGTEVINRINGTLGNAEFYSQGTIAGLDRLVAGDGFGVMLDSEHVTRTQTGIATQGGRGETGLALIRGDNTSAWFVGTIDPQSGIDPDQASQLDSEHGWILSTEASASVTGQTTPPPFYYHQPAGAENEADNVTWTFSNLNPQTRYQVFVNWTPGADRAAQVEYKISGGRLAGLPGQDDDVTSVIVDQRYTPGEELADGSRWRSLGYFVPENGTLTVDLLPNAADGRVVAGQVMLIDTWAFETPAGSFETTLAIDTAQTVDPDATTVLLAKFGNTAYFDADGLLTLRTDRNENRTKFTYTDADNDTLADELETITLQGGLTWTYAYGEDGRLHSITDFAGRETTFEMTEFFAGQALTILEPAPFTGIARPETHVTIFADSYALSDAADNHYVVGLAGNTDSVSAASDGWETYSALRPQSMHGIDPQLSPSQSSSLDGTILLAPDGQIGNRQLAADTSLVEARARYTDARGFVYEYQTDRFGLLTALAKPATVQDNLGRDVWLWDRNELGLVDTFTEPTGAAGKNGALGELVTRYEYDGHGNLHTMLLPDSGEGALRAWNYGAFDQVTSFTDELGRETLYDLDDYGNVVNVEQLSSDTDHPTRITSFIYTDAPTDINALAGGLILFEMVVAGPSTTATTETQYITEGNHIGLVRKVIYADEKFVEFFYDSNRNLDKFRDELYSATQVETDYDYDALNRLAQVTLPAPETGDHGAAVTRYEYDGAGRLIAEYDPRHTENAPVVTNYAYNALGQVTSVTSPIPGGDTSSSQNRQSSQYMYDAAGNLVQVTENGVTTRFEYDERNQKIADKLPAPNVSGQLHGESTVAYHYDALGNLVSVTDGRNYTTQFKYDEQHRQVQVILPATVDNPASVTEYEYDAAGQFRFVHTPGPNGHDVTTGYEYNSFGEVILVTPPAVLVNGESESNTVSTRYDLRGNVIQVAYADGRVTDYQYDLRNRLTLVTAPDPGDGNARLVTKYEYDDDGNVVKEYVLPKPDYDYLLNDDSYLRERARITEYAYDTLQRLKQIIAPEPDPEDSVDERLVTQFHYDTAGNVSKTYVLPMPTNSADLEDEEYLAAHARISNYESDNLNRQWHVEGPQLADGSRPETITLYNARGQVSAVREAVEFLPGVGEEPGVVRYRSTNYTYDNLGRLYQVIGPAPEENADRPTTTYHYDQNGNLQYTIDPLGRKSETVYDARNQASSIYTPPAEVNEPGTRLETKYAYYQNGSVQSITNQSDPFHPQTIYAYDDLGRVLQHTEGQTAQEDSSTTLFTYDLAGRLESITDPEVNITTFDYNARGQLRNETIYVNGLPLERIFEYDQLGRLEYSTDRNGRVTKYEYDQLGRVKHEKWLDGENVVRDIAFDYNVLGELKSVDDAEADYAYDYDEAGRLKEETQQFGGLSSAVQLVSGYNLLGLRTSLTAKLGSSTQFVDTYVYDDLSRLTRLTQTGPTAGKRVDFEYNAAGQFKLITRYEEDLLGSQLVASSHYDYDDLGRLTSLWHERDAVTLSGYGFEYDAAGRLELIDSWLDGESSFNYDDQNQLVAADFAGQTDEGFSYDENGNRTNSGYATGDHNRLASDGVFNYEYDNEGNLIRKTEVANPDNVIKYQWDWRNRLLRVEFLDLSGETPVVVKSSNYAYDYANRWIKQSIDADGAGAAAAVDTFFAQDGNQMLWELNGSGDIQHNYLWGPAVDQLLADENALGDILWGLSDQLGTNRDLAAYDAVEEETQVVNHRVFSAFGQQLSQSDPEYASHIGFTGRPTDSFSGLNNHLNRWYDPLTGRWITIDPIGIESGTANFYGYTSNQPTMMTDPSGLAVMIDRSSQTEVTPGSIYDPTPGSADAGADSLLSPSGWWGFLTGWERRQRTDGTYYWRKFSDPYTVNPNNGNLQAPAGPNRALHQVGRSVETAITLSAASGGLGGKAPKPSTPASPKQSQVETPKLPVKEGIYEFPDQTMAGKPYVGQSGNVPNRLMQHKAAGRLEPGTESTTTVSGGTTAREVAEHTRIQEITGGQKASNSPAVANMKDPIGPKRRPDLGLPAPKD